ncbi:hypothetical protein [Planococcus citreus]|uniref:Uncharacterized protein n=1 Tax=Planococcus citreus TaxID=1373 RepID=A0A497YLV8_9BACL|nr:hypothetical protein [Planococcus citreus]RLJ90732.1 hypothetical protein DFR62_0881 [Planococcus citreus]
MNKRKELELVHLRRICHADVGAAAFPTFPLANKKRLKPCPGSWQRDVLSRQLHDPHPVGPKASTCSDFIG